MSDVETLFGPIDRPIRLGVFLSGGGTTLLNLLQTIERGELKAEIPLVVSDRDGVAGLDHAAAAGLPCCVLPRRDCESAAAWSDAAFQACRAAEIDLVVLAGFLSLVVVPEDFLLRVMNIHPALIPAFAGKGFYGQRVHEAALERGVRVSGCTVHFADNQYDHGPIILQQVVPVENGDSPGSLAARVFTAECQAYPEAIRLFASGRLRISDGQLHVG
ncbi:MAG: phosphoribosylglycinamide formyltransferase [Planctomycetaceae bacterium]